MKIEKNVPLPELKTRGPKPKYPWADFEVGDSCFVEGNFKDVNKCKEATSARLYGYRNGKKFSTIKVGGGVRIWRVE